MLIQIGNPQLVLHPCPVPVKILLPCPAALHHQGTDFLQQLHVLLLPIQPAHCLKQQIRILFHLADLVEHLIHRLPFQYPLSGAVIQHLALKISQLPQQRRISVEHGNRLNIQDGTCTSPGIQPFQKPPSVPVGSAVITGQIQKQPRHPPVPVVPPENMLHVPRHLIHIFLISVNQGGKV